MKITNSLGLSFAFDDRGRVRSIEAGPVRVSLTLASACGSSGVSLYLRVRGGASTPLLGAAAPGRFRVAPSGFRAAGAGPA